ncbi:hypothetical protein BDR07DRAFT_1087452 [Suillus spraguei]|nr:hypothetical protein BDR07DRAFT_1087452 [Suillus spraguei]
MTCTLLQGIGPIVSSETSTGTSPQQNRVRRLTLKFLITSPHVCTKRPCVSNYTATASPGVQGKSFYYYGRHQASGPKGHDTCLPRTSTLICNQPDIQTLRSVGNEKIIITRLHHLTYQPRLDQQPNRYHSQRTVLQK